MKKNLPFFIWFFIWAVACLIVMFTTQGLGDNADGVMHYMFARYAHLHLDNFLDPWAKTGYTLVAWPFAQFGLQGVFFLNIVCTGISMWLVYKISQAMGIQYAWVAPIILSLSTLYFTLQFSGLTEHVFSCVLISIIYLLLKNKWFWGTLLLSSLPFFRQEGYIIMASLLPFYFYRRKIRMLPLLGVSFLMVALAGAIRYDDAFWIIRSNPYKYSQTYGHGQWYIFFVHLYYSNGLINLILFIIGLIGLGLYRVKKFNIQRPFLFLAVVVPFIAVFSAHALFWYLGIFHSMGLPRVLNCITPLFAVVGALGFSLLIRLVQQQKAKLIIGGMLVGFIIIYPFTPSPSAIPFKKQFVLSANEQQLKEASEVVKTNFSGQLVYAEHPVIPFFLSLDPFNKEQFQRMFMIDLLHLQPGAILIWDDHFSLLQAGVQEGDLTKHEQLIKIKEYPLNKGKQRIVIFRVKN